MRPARVCGIIAAFVCAVISHPCPTSYATELHPNGYTISQVIQLALQHNPKMKGAEAALEQSRNQRVTAGAYRIPPSPGPSAEDRFAILEPGSPSPNGLLQWSSRWSGWASERPDNAPLRQA